MSKSQESGHAKNVALFEERSLSASLSGGVQSWTGAFAIPAMQAMLQSMKNIMERIRNAQVDNNNAINSGLSFFREMKKIAGQLFNSLDAYGASKNNGWCKGPAEKDPWYSCVRQTGRSTRQGSFG